MVYIFIGLISILVLFLWSACKLSSEISKWEEINYNSKNKR